jgi:NAD(P)-dependent dehydrogenase (short-subunit alcohol dehydrogenase family)
MAESRQAKENRAPVAMIIGATTKWQADGRNTLFAHGEALDDSGLPPSVRWGAGGALALKFASEGYLTAATSRKPASLAPLMAAIEEEGGKGLAVELDVTSEESIAAAFVKVREEAGEPDVVIYNCGYFEGRDLPPEMELFEHMPVEIFDAAHLVAARGPFLVVKQVLGPMRERGSGSIFFSNNPYCLRGRKRNTGESLYYPRVMQRSLAQALAEEYSPYGVHVANVIIDGLIDSPGTRELEFAKAEPGVIMDPAAIADTFWYLHTQDPSCWTYEVQITPHKRGGASI